LELAEELKIRLRADPPLDRIDVFSLHEGTHQLTANPVTFYVPLLGFTQNSVADRQRFGA
jgi:hypothetical protein